MKKIVEQDLNRIYKALSDKEKEKLKDSKILLTGCAGFLGFYFMNFFSYFKEDLGIQKIIGLDNFKVGYPKWLKDLKEEGKIELHEFDIIKDNIEDINGLEDINFIYHMASIASPTFYRKYPIETLDANVWGLRKLLEYYKNKEIKGFVFYSSSEIYGDPFPEYIPTKEDYRGNVACTGPRACYDEAKRFGETICYLFNEKYKIPISIIRPFNNYGPGMRINDKRVPADFAKAVYENRDIIIYSDGSPTRTFCYISDAITGYLKALLLGKFNVFNIGIDKPEISIKELANIYREIGKEVLGYSGTVKFEIPDDAQYLTDNPNRRCPDISKAREILDYNPIVDVREGVHNFLEYIKESTKEELEW